MAQFDVHRNTGKHRDTVPFVVVVQSSLFDDYRRRVVVPLVRKSAIAKIGHGSFNPTFKVAGISVVFHPLDIVSMPCEQMGDFVASLSHEGQGIMTALDELLTQAWK